MPLAVAVSALWDVTPANGGVNVPLTRTHLDAAAQGVNSAKPAANLLNQDVGPVRVFVGPPLRAQTIAGTAKGQVRVLCSSATTNVRAQCVIRVCNFAGTAVTGTLYAGDPAELDGDPASEWATALTNRQMPRGGAVDLTELAVNHGDRLVVEPGYRVHSTDASARTVTVSRGAVVGAADLPEDETETGSLAPWIEFSQDLRFLGGAALVRLVGRPLGRALARASHAAAAPWGS